MGVFKRLFLGLSRNPSSSRGQTPAAGNDFAARAIERADALRDAGNPTEAALLYGAALAEDPQRNDLRAQLGNMLKDSGRYAEAEEVYRTAISLCGPAETDTLADLHLQLGRCLHLAGRPSDALNAYERALEHNPVHRDVLLERARLALLGVGLVAGSNIVSAVERLTPHRIEGFVVNRDRPQVPVWLDLIFDSIPFCRIEANLPRGDLVERIPKLVGGGFECPVPPGTGTAEIVLKVVDGPLVAGPLTIERVPLQQWPVQETLARLSSLPAVAVVVPVFNAPSCVRACLKSLLEHCVGDVRLIVIDDASDDAAVWPMLEKLADRGIEVYRNDRNRGYTATANRGLALAGDRDVVLLNSDAVVGPRWLENLRLAVSTREKVASATAISDNAGVFTLLEEAPSGIAPVPMQRLIMKHSVGAIPLIPTGSGFCIYMRRAALDVVGLLDDTAFPVGYCEENDWAMRAARAGWSHVLDDRTLVFHRRSASFGEARREALTESGLRTLEARYPEYAPLIAGMNGNAALNLSRWKVRRLTADLRAGVIDGNARPRLLFVVSTQTGGTPLTNGDLMEGVRDEFEPWLLRSDGHDVWLYRVDAGGHRVEIDHCELVEPVSYLTHRSESYTAVVARWLAAHAIELVHIRHMAWHGVDLPEIAAALAIPVVLSFHDFYTGCPTVKLLDERLLSCGGVCTATPGDCIPDLWSPGAAPRLKSRYVLEWRRRFAEAFDHVDAFITTSAVAHRRLLDMFPKLSRARFEIIPHGRDFEFAWTAGEGHNSGPLKILVPGNLTPAKGRDMIESVARADEGRSFVFHVLGHVHPQLDAPGVVAHGSYARDEFLERARAIGAHIGAVLSIWDETWCHTLTELWAAGLPVIGFDFGAVAERLNASGAGWIVPDASPEALRERLTALAADPRERASKTEAVRRWQEGEGLLQNVPAMAARYKKLYSDVASARRAFARGSICG